MTHFEAILLGIVQGVTEFLPVSSSGHLILFEHFLGLTQLSKYVFFDLICHLGTLGAILIVFFKDIKELFTDVNKLKLIIIAVLPLFPLVLLMKPIKGLFDQPEWLGYGFLITACILLLGYHLGGRKIAENSPKCALYIGIAQSFAILPGISRSGTTISAARLMNWSPSAAVTFSFLLSIPTILGGMVLECIKLNPSLMPSIDISTYFCGFLSSLIVGYFSLRALIRIVGTAKFQYFGWYCAGLGLLLIYYFH